IPARSQHQIVLLEQRPELFRCLGKLETHFSSGEASLPRLRQDGVERRPGAERRKIVIDPGDGVDGETDRHGNSEGWKKEPAAAQASAGMSNFWASIGLTLRRSASSRDRPANTTRAAVPILWIMSSISAWVCAGLVTTITERLRISSERWHMSLE